MNDFRDMEYDIPKVSVVSTASFIAVVVFAAFCVFFHWFGEAGWVPILDSANLVLHEAGHPLVGIFIHRAGVYGGTLFQIVFPLAAIWHFHRAGHETGLAVAFIWLGENLLNIARYMADARAQVLPLLGGDHDWTEIFGRWGVLHLDGRIAGLTRIIGNLLIFYALFRVYRCWRAPPENTDLFI